MNQKRIFSPAEWQVLEYITEHHPATVREVTEHFAHNQGWARTTVLTLIERLRAKGYLNRDETGTIHRYSPSSPKSDLMQSLVQDFVEKALGGSVSPFVAYLGAKTDLTAVELDELRKIVGELDVAEAADAAASDAPEENQDA
jgi:BlaI family penicillinase repressor